MPGPSAPLSLLHLPRLPRRKYLDGRYCAGPTLEQILLPRFSTRLGCAGVPPQPRRPVFDAEVPTGASRRWGQLAEGVVERDKVLYVSAPRRVETLENRPPRLTEVQRSGVNEALEKIHRPGV